MVLRLRQEAPDWEQAKCSKHPPSRQEDAWFGETDGHPDEALLPQAARICNGDDDLSICPLRHACLLYALINTEAAGVWGGMLPEDLKYMRNHIDPKEWIWRPGFPNEQKAEGYLLRARKSRVA